MRFWDSSALVPLLAQDVHTPRAEAIFADDPAMAVWWATEIECASALARLERMGAFAEGRSTEAWVRLDALRACWTEVAPSDALRRTARRVVRVHPLRAADAQQLAAALVAADGRPDALEIVTFDERLAEAAAGEGLVLIGNA